MCNLCEPFYRCYDFQLRREALEIWKQRKGLNATYRNLMDVFSRAGYQTCADRIQEICMNTGKCVYILCKYV